MKKGLNAGVLIIIIIAGIYVGLNINETGINVVSNEAQETSDPYKELRSDEKHTKEEDFIKKEVDEHMHFNFAKYGKTSWYDSISSSSAVINEGGRFFVVQIKSNADEEKAKEYVGGLLSFFNAKTTDPKFLVDKVIVVDKEFNIVYEKETIKW
jgi:hypothetical protein